PEQDDHERRQSASGLSLLCLRTALRPVAVRAYSDHSRSNAEFPYAILGRHAAGAWSEPGGNRGGSIGKEHTLATISAALDRAERRRTVEAAENPGTAMTSDGAGLPTQNGSSPGIQKSIRLHGGASTRDVGRVLAFRPA